MVPYRSGIVRRGISILMDSSFSGFHNSAGSISEQDSDYPDTAIATSTPIPALKVLTPERASSTHGLPEYLQ